MFWWKSKILSPVPSNQSRPWCCWQNKKSWAPYFNVIFCGNFSSSFNSHVVQTKSCISSLCVLPSFLCSFHLFASTRKPLLCHWQTPAAPLSLSRLMQRVYINTAATFTFHCVDRSFWFFYLTNIEIVVLNVCLKWRWLFVWTLSRWKTSSTVLVFLGILISMIYCK